MLVKKIAVALAITLGATSAGLAQGYGWHGGPNDRALQWNGYYGTPYGPGPDYGYGGGDQYGYGPGYGYGTQAPSPNSGIESQR